MVSAAELARALGAYAADGAVAECSLPLVFEQFGMQVVTLIWLGLIDLHRDAVGVGPGILANAGRVPGYLRVRLVGRDRNWLPLISEEIQAWAGWPMVVSRGLAGCSRLACRNGTNSRRRAS
jgi:hypothetical protein